MSDPQRFKAAARRFASGVTVVSTRVDCHVHGITASSFSALSLDPLLVTVAVDHRSQLIEMVESAQCFAISVLARGQYELSRHFATPNRSPSVDRFELAASYPATTGAPVLAGCIAFFDCRLHSVLPGGDHRILVGEVVAAGESGGEPLLYFEGDYHGLGLPHTPPLGPRDAAAAARADESGTAMQDLPVTDLLEVQRTVEPRIAELAASQATADDLQRLRRLVESATEVVDDPSTFTRLGVEFHVALADASGNRTLRTLAASLREEQQLAYESRTDADRARVVLAAHRHILSLLESGDAAGARAATLEHVVDMQRHFSAVATSRVHGGTGSIGRTSMPASAAGSIARPT